MAVTSDLFLFIEHILVTTIYTRHNVHRFCCIIQSTLTEKIHLRSLSNQIDDDDDFFVEIPK